MSMQFVKGALIVYGVIACFFIFLLWRNASAPDALKNAGVALASILPIALLVLPYLNPETIEKRYTYMLIFDSRQKALIRGQQPNSYSLAYSWMFAGPRGLEDAWTGESFSEFAGEKGFDLIERGILQVMLLRFSSTWDLGPVVRFRGPGFLGAETFPAARTDSNGTEITLPQLQAIFKHNRLISHVGVVALPKLTLPPDSTLQTEQTDHKRIIKISNPKLSAQIRIAWQLGTVLQQGIWGVQPPDSSDMNRYGGVFFVVSVSGEIGRTWIYSPDIAAYRRWFDNLSDALSQYDWEKIDHDIH